MTVNIALIGNTGIHLCADMRFSSMRGELIELLPKVVLLSYKDWVALISYAGIGRDGNGLSTSDWLVQTLSHTGGAQRSFEEVAESVRSAGTQWLLRIPAEYRRHTFMIAGVIRGRPRIGMISNFQSIGGDALESPESELYLSEPRPSETYRRALVSISGVYDAVKPYRAYLRNLYKGYRVDVKDDEKRKRNVDRIQQLISSVNGKASESKVGKKWISSQCLVFSLFPAQDGTCELIGSLYGDFPNEEVFMESITNGTHSTPTLRDSAKQAAKQENLPGRSFRFVGVSVKVVPGVAEIVLWVLRPLPVPRP